jgi:hypothetical protein
MNTQEVLCNLNEEVEYILKKSWEDREAPYSFDDMEIFISSMLKL